MTVDYAAYQSWLGTALQDYANITVTPGGPIIGPVTVSGFPAVEVHIVPQGGPITATWSFSTDQAGNNHLEQYVWNIPAGTRLDVILPASGQFFQLLLQTADGASATNTLVYIVPVDEPTGELKFIEHQPELLKTNASVGAGATSMQLLPGWIAGPCYAMVAARDTSGMLTFTLGTAQQTNLPLALLHPLAEFGAPTTTAQLTQNLILPAAATVLQIVNADAVNAHHYDAAIIPQVSRI